MLRAVAQGSDPALSGSARPRNSRSPERDQFTPSSSPLLTVFSPCQYSARRSPPSHCSPQPAAPALFSASTKRNSSRRSSPGKGAASNLPGKRNRVSSSTEESNLKTDHMQPLRNRTARQGCRRPHYRTIRSFKRHALQIRLPEAQLAPAATGSSGGPSSSSSF